MVWCIRVIVKLKGKFYRTTIRSTMLYKAECWATKKQHVHKMELLNENAKVDVWTYKVRQD